MGVYDEVKLHASTAMEAILPIARRQYFGQFGEDAVLQSLLGDKIKAGEPGFYVDVGAFSPKVYSNTYWFYRRGWRGINIDPTPGSMRAFRLMRPRDVNLECAVSEAAGEVTFYQLGIHSVMNTLSRELAEERQRQDGCRIIPRTVPCRPLANILGEHLPSRTEIDSLSIDVEGHDLAVLRSNDWRRWRPGIVIVEDHEFSFEARASSGVGQFLIEQGYRLCAWVPPSLIFKR
jgi:FkbM family methyltransferase